MEIEDFKFMSMARETLQMLEQHSLTFEGLWLYFHHKLFDDKVEVLERLFKVIYWLWSQKYITSMEDNDGVVRGRFQWLLRIFGIIQREGIPIYTSRGFQITAKGHFKLYPVFSIKRRRVYES